MDSVRDLCLVGLSHRTASVAARERYAVQAEDVPGCLRGLCEAGSVAESAVVSTCNRTEVLVRAVEGRDPADDVRRALFRNAAEGEVYAYRGLHAVIHLFRVASGLDSLVMGESEILGQVRRAVELAREAGTLGGLLKPLFDQALAAGKRVRSETELGQGTLSVARVGVDVAKRAFGKLDSAHALLIGAGETGQLVAKHLAAEGIASIHFANRTLDRAQALAAEYGGQAFGLDALVQGIARADLIVSAVDGAPGLLHRGLLDRRALARRDRPLVILDLSIPRAAEPALAEQEQVLLFGLDDLQPILDGNMAGRQAAVARADEMIVAEVHEFLARRAYAFLSPALSELPARFEELRESVLDEVTAGAASPRELELAHALVKRMLHLALGHLKEGVRRVRSETALDQEYQRFLENQ